MFTDSRIRIAVLVFSLLIAVTAVACQPLPAAPTQDAAPVQPQEAPRDPSNLAPDECVDLLATITDFMRADDYAAVVTLVDTVLDCGIDDELKAGLFFLRAESNMKQGEWQTAIDDYRDALAFGLAAEDAAGARNNICWFFALDNQAEAALPYCEQAVDASPSASYLDSRALAYALLGQNEAAIADFEAALAEWAGSQNPQIQAIRTEREEWVATLRAGDNPITQEVLARLQAEDAPALSADLDSVSDPAATELFLSGRQHHLFRQFDQAREAYSQAIELDPDYAIAYFYRGLVHLWQEDWEDALGDMQRVALLKPDQAHAHHVAGLMHMRQEDYVDAVASFSAAIDLLPNQTDFYADRAAAYFSLGDAESALTDLDSVLRFEPEFRANALHARGRASNSGQPRRGYRRPRARARTGTALRAGRTGPASPARTARRLLLALCEKSLPLGRSGGTGPSPTDGSTERGHFLPCHPLMRRRCASHSTRSADHPCTARTVLFARSRIAHTS